MIILYRQFLGAKISSPIYIIFDIDDVSQKKDFLSGPRWGFRRGDVDIAFLADYAVVDKIIDHLKLSLVADRLPPPQVPY